MTTVTMTTGRAIALKAKSAWEEPYRPSDIAGVLVDEDEQNYTIVEPLRAKWWVKKAYWTEDDRR